MIFQSGKYNIELFTDGNYFPESIDDINSYDKVYFIKSDYRITTKIGLKVYENERIISSVIIGSTEGSTAIHKNSQIIEDNRIVVCCSDYVFCLSLPDLDLIWKTKADEITCFQIFKFKNSYIVHGELEISMLDLTGKVLWKNTGSDIFTSLDGKDNFEITNSYIKVTDWENRVYKFDFNGVLLSDD